MSSTETRGNKIYEAAYSFPPGGGKLQDSVSVHSMNVRTYKTPMLSFHFSYHTQRQGSAC